MLRSAGFDHIIFERFDTDICIGRTLDEAVEFGMALGPAGEIIRLAGEEGERRRPEAVAALCGSSSPKTSATTASGSDQVASSSKREIRRFD